jgi:hypothetical protein
LDLVGLAAIQSDFPAFSFSRLSIFILHYPSLAPDSCLHFSPLTVCLPDQKQTDGGALLSTCPAVALTKRDHRLASCSAMSGDQHFAAGHPTHFKLSKNTTDHRPYPSEYHILLKTVIRPANKKLPHSQKSSIYTKRYQSNINDKSHLPKCPN